MYGQNRISGSSYARYVVNPLFPGYGFGPEHMVIAGQNRNFDRVGSFFVAVKQAFPGLHRLIFFLIINYLFAENNVLHRIDGLFFQKQLGLGMPLY